MSDGDDGFSSDGSILSGNDDGTLSDSAGTNFSSVPDSSTGTSYCAPTDSSQLYTPMQTFAPGPDCGSLNYCAGPTFTPPCGDPSYSPDPVTGEPSAGGTTPVSDPPPGQRSGLGDFLYIPVDPSPPLQPPLPPPTTNPPATSPPPSTTGSYFAGGQATDSYTGLPTADSPATGTPPNVTASPFTGQATDPYTGQPVRPDSDISGTPTPTPAQQLPSPSQTGYGSSGVPDAGVRQPPADAGNWYTPQQFALFRRNQQISAQIGLQLSYLAYLRSTFAFGSSYIPSFGEFVSRIMSLPFNPQLGPPGQVSISGLPVNDLPGPSLSAGPPIWTDFTKGWLSEAETERLNSTLLNPGSYLAVLPAEAITEMIFGEALEGEALAAGSFPEKLGNVVGDPGYFGVTTTETYLVRAGSPGVPGSWGDHLFESLAEAQLYAEQLAASGERSIRNYTALARIWEGGAQGNEVQVVSIWRVPVRTAHIINVVGKQLEGGTVLGTPLFYPGGGPQVIIERGVRLDLAAPELPVVKPGSRWF
jgi:hypothetical protein